MRLFYAALLLLVGLAIGYVYAQTQTVTVFVGHENADPHFIQLCNELDSKTFDLGLDPPANQKKTCVGALVDGGSYLCTWKQSSFPSDSLTDNEACAKNTKAACSVNNSITSSSGVKRGGGICSAACDDGTWVVVK